MLLNTEIMASFTNNEFFVTDVRQFMPDRVITVITNGSSQVFDRAGMLRFLPLCVHLNIYSMETVQHLSMLLILH